MVKEKLRTHDHDQFFLAFDDVWVFLGFGVQSKCFEAFATKRFPKCF